MALSQVATTEESILDAAESCFLAEGVRATTIDDVAAAAGVSRITVYRRIGNRDELIRTVLLRVTVRFLERLRPSLRAEPDLASALTLLVKATVRSARRDDLSLLFASEDRGATGTPIPGATAPLVEAFGVVVAELAAQHRNQFDPSVPPSEAGEWLLRVILSLATIEVDRSPSQVDAWICRFVLPGLVLHIPEM